MSDAQRPGEDDLIARYFRPLAGPAGLSLLDDVACLAPTPGQDLVLTADALVAGVHFFPHDPPEAIGWKALGVNLSDLAAKGAEPLGFLLSLALPPGWTAGWLEAFAAGLGDLAGRSGCPLAGGDTVRTPGPLTLSITAFGEVPAGRMVARTGARPGDRLYVSGTIGDAALGLQLRIAEEPRRAPADWIQALAEGEREYLRERYLRPQPRLALRRALVDHATGAMDVSDGLVGDLQKMMRASGTGASVALETVPLSPPARRAAADSSAFHVCVTGGDDYEVLCSVPEDRAGPLVAAAASAGVPVTAIGKVGPAGSPVTFVQDGKVVSFDRGSFSHF
jgi:thiamine-monophosphate kinase